MLRASCCIRGHNSRSVFKTLASNDAEAILLCLFIMFLWHFKLKVRGISLGKDVCGDPVFVEINQGIEQSKYTSCLVEQNNSRWVRLATDPGSLLNSRSSTVFCNINTGPSEKCILLF